MPRDVFDGIREQVADNRSQFCLDLAPGPFYGYNRPEARRKDSVVRKLVQHADADQIVPYANAGVLSAKLLKNGVLKLYKGFIKGSAWINST